MATSTLLVPLLVLCCVPLQLKAWGKNNVIEDMVGPKELKKIIRTRTNLLVVFAKTDKSANKNLPLLEETAKEIKGKGTLAFVDCSHSDNKKVCKNHKINFDSTEGWVFKHYKDGEYNKDYDRPLTVKSMLEFFRDPTGEAPWEEDPTAKDVIHITDPTSYAKLMKKEMRPMLVMFYAPWCGFCKRIKPEFAAAATEVKPIVSLVGIDVDRPEMLQIRMDNNITGFPTINFVEKGKFKMRYGGENTKEGIVSWLKDPNRKGPEDSKSSDKEWAAEDNEVVFLDDTEFDGFIQDNPSVLVMFYAPWCGHCKKMKPEYDEAAKTMVEQKIAGSLVAVDATKAKKIGEQYKVTGYPTVKYFKEGSFAFDVNERTADKIVEFMKDPKEPPPPPPADLPWSETESDVQHLTDDTFKSFIKKKKHTLVMFYAPWCGHCKKAKPEFTQAAARFKDNTKVAFTAVDCTVHTAVCTQHEVTGYPTLVYFNYGKNSQKYMGGREEADFIGFMRDPLNTGTVEAHVPPSKPAEEVPPSKPAEKEAPPAKPAEKEAPPAKPAEKETPPTAQDQWTDVTGHENIHILDEKNFDSFIAEHNSVLVMFYAPWCGHCKNMKPAWGEAATKLKEEGLESVLAAVDTTAARDLGSKYEVKGYPTVKYFKDGKFAFDYKSKRTTDAIVEFLKDPKEPPPPPPPPAPWSDEPSEVKHLSVANFTSFLESHEHVLVMFYAPWCGHCKRAKPAFMSAAEKLKDDPSKMLAAINCVDDPNRPICSKEEVKGFPSIKLYIKGQKLVDYKGDRSEMDMIKFITNAPEPMVEPPKPEEKVPPKADKKDVKDKKKPKEEL